jgi:hypothetical protein
MQAPFGDLRFGARMLTKSPGFTLAAIVTLALGIGANAAIFTVTSALLLRPFPYHEPQQLVSLDVKNRTTNFTAHWRVTNCCATATTPSSRWPHGRMTI